MPRQPNVILILADDMGYGDIGAFNEGRSRTPALDAMAADGLHLRRHYSGSPVCNPARAALMTGRYPHRTGSIDTFEGRGLDRLALRERTMGDVFRDAGYTTGLIGKWHLGALDMRWHPMNRGFDETLCFRGGWQDYYDWQLTRNGAVVRPDGRYLTDVWGDEAVGFVRRHARETQPFFLHVTYNAPHWPYQALDSDLAEYADPGKYTPGQAMIYAMIAAMDRGVGRIREEVRAQGIEEDTIILFTSDNGPDLGPDWGLDTDRFNCDLRGWKTWVYEGGIRVPMLLRWPGGGIDGGRACDATIHFVDWLPTLLGAAGHTPPRDRVIDGRNVLDVLRGEVDRDEERVERFWQWNRYSPVGTSNAAFRRGPWKLVRPRIPETVMNGKEDAEVDYALKYRRETITDITRTPEPARTIPPPKPPELYNIADDPREQNDVAGTYPEIAGAMLADLERLFAEVEAERHTINDVW